uniref:Uncharacterized protein n=1 Tax=Neobacillus citreus TaxID=2833578 RepID=A0A942YG49_9BACI
MEDEQFRDSPPNESPEKLINQLENVKSADTQIFMATVKKGMLLTLKVKE